MKHFNFYLNKITSRKIKIIFFVLLIGNLVSCESNPIKISKEYYVNDRDSGLGCYQCDSSWKLKFLNESELELWTYYGDKGQYQSCLSTGNYTYDNDSKTITILNVSSRSAMKCVSRFKGKWKYKEVESGLKGFVSLNNPDWKFQTYSY